MHLPRLLPLAFALILAACVDTTGISADLKRPAHPGSNPAASVIVREYADLQCPACRAAFEVLNPQIIEKFGKDIRLELMHFPLQTLHPWALAAAEAAECAADQGKFWEYTDLVYLEQDKLDGKQLIAWAEQLKLESDLFDRCTRSHIKRKAIIAEYDQGSKLGVRGTPTYLVNGKVTEATIDALGAAIEAAKTSAPRL